MNKKKNFLIILIITIVVLSVLLMFNKKTDTSVLIIEADNGEFSEINLKDIQQLKGINFNEVKRTSETLEDDDISLYSFSLLNRFYNRYSEDKGKDLIKVFYIDQIIRLSQLQIMDYRQLVFHSSEGARVIIEPTEHKDFLVLLSLEKNRGALSLRLIMPEDNFSQRWLKHIVKITVIP